ncbi:MAG TPA: CvpA family protein [Puia sp.]|jgi:membrane protein required for colicin V production
MPIDVVFLLFMVMAVYKGLRQGFLLAVFSTIALIIGLAAAIKLSAVVAGYGRTGMHWSSRWLPVFAFVLVFLAVVILIRLSARLAEKAMDLAMMGWLNKLAGIFLYAVIYTIILSVGLFYAVQVHMISSATLSSSVTYSRIRPWGPRVIDEFGKFVPWFKGMFAQLEDFFQHIGQRL